MGRSPFHMYTPTERFLKIRQSEVLQIEKLVHVVVWFNPLPNDKILDVVGWLNGVLGRFQQYFSHITAIVHIIHVFPGFHQY